MCLSQLGVEGVEGARVHRDGEFGYNQLNRDIPYESPICS